MSLADLQSYLTSTLPTHRATVKRLWFGFYRVSVTTPEGREVFNASGLSESKAVERCLVAIEKQR